jgi:acyl-CoA synthetase (AMP-forming)/AMP-acid ligase II
LGEHLQFVKNKTSNTKTVLIKNADVVDVNLFEGVEKVFIQGGIDEGLRKKIQVKGCLVYESLILDTGEIISVNTPDIVSSDVNGKKMNQSGSKEGTLGRALPGVAVKLLSENGKLILSPNEEGQLWVNPVGYTAEEWVDAKKRASIDEDGFISVME